MEDSMCLRINIAYVHICKAFIDGMIGVDKVKSLIWGYSTLTTSFHVIAALWRRINSRFYAFSFLPLQEFLHPFWACTASSYVEDVPPYPLNSYTWPDMTHMA